MASIRSLLFRESEWLSPNGRGGDLFSVRRYGEKTFNSSGGQFDTISLLLLKSEFLATFYNTGC